MSFDEKQLAKRLQLARQAAGLTQQALCHKAGLSYSTLAKIERGAIKTPSIFTVQSIAAALGVSLDELLGPASLTLPRHLKRSENGVTFVYFDVNDCIVERFFPQALAKLAAESGKSPNMIEELFWRYDADMCRGTMSFHTFNDIFISELGLPHFDWRQLYLETSQTMPHMNDLLGWASQQYRIGLLSNSMPELIPLLIENKILPDITYDVIIDSSQVHIMKPEQAIFDTSQERAGVPASEILLVDDMRSNIQAAQQQGWHVLLYDGTTPEESAQRVKSALAFA